MGILRTDRVTGLGGANAITGSAFFAGGKATTTSSDYALGTDDFTVEFFVYFSGKHTTLSNIIETRSATTASDGFLIGRFQTSGHENKIEMYTAQNYRVTADRTVENDTWVHVALVRASATTKLYVDGTAYSTTYSDSNNYSNTEMIFGKNVADTYQLTGFISNFHVVKGTAIYTSNFTPPTNQIQKRSDTVFLGFQSASDVTREETGKIITFPVSGHNSVSHGPDTSKSVISSRFTPNSPVGFSTITDVGTQFGSTFDGVTTFDSQAYFVPPSGNKRERNRGRGLIGQGKNTTSPNNIKGISFIEIQSGGTAFDFGDSTNGSMYAMTAVSSSTRAVFAGGHTSQASPYPVTNLMEFVTISTTSNCTDFGDLNVGAANRVGASNQTRGLIAAGYAPNTRNIDKIEIATLGDATDYGDLDNQGFYGLNSGGMVSSSTRGLYAGGSGNSAPVAVNTITFSLFSSAGNSTDFGDLTHTNAYFNIGNSNGTRGIFMGGGDIDSPYPSTDQIDFVTIASEGNATDFGSLNTSRYAAMGASNSTRGVIAGGRIQPAPSLPATNLMEFVNIASTGNGSSFGELIESENSGAGCSDSHGGLS